MGTVRAALVDSLLDRHETLAGQLQELYVAQSELAHQRQVLRLETWFASEAATLGERDKEADWASLPVSQEFVRVESEIRSVQEERDHVRLVLTHMSKDS